MPLCPIHVTLPCQYEHNGEVRCCFEESVPEGSTFVEGDKFSRVLLYRAPDGRPVAVPNFRYNLPVDRQVELVKQDAERCRERARHHRASRLSDAHYLAHDMEAQAERLDKMAEEMSRGSSPSVRKSFDQNTKTTSD